MSNASDNTSNASITEVGIIGAGAIGQAMAGQLVRAGLKIIVSNSHRAESLAPLVAQLGPLARAAPFSNSRAARCLD